MRKILLLLLLCVLGAIAQAPWQESGLVNWSSQSSWNVQNASVVIPANTKVLLDSINPSLILYSVIIPSGSQLICNNTNLNINFYWMRFDAGSKLRCGSAQFPITQKVVFTLYGERRASTESPIGQDPADGTNFGWKGLIIATGASVEIYGALSSPSWTRLTQTSLLGSSSLVVEDLVQWKSGDQIVIASTDFGPVINSRDPSVAGKPSVSWAVGSPGFPEQTEVRTIVSVAGNTITLDRPLNFTHWGQGFERAEIGLLTRNVVIQGDISSSTDGFGGHLMMRNGYIFLSGLEVTRMGQRGILGRYPIHFHLLKDDYGQATIQHSSIHDNFQRAVVIHESHGVQILNNVAYNTIGHMYFLEDGPERGNVFDRNLGLVVRAVPNEDTPIIPTDSSPTIFWITNPNNTFTNNAAIGGRFCYWFALPNRPIGLSVADYANDIYIYPRLTPLGVFANNVAHGCIDTGLEIDNFLTPLGEIEPSTSYTPRTPPYNTTSSPGVEALFQSFTAYKCRQFGVWAKTSLRFNNLQLADNRVGIMTNGYTLVENGYIEGESANTGYPLPGRGHSRSFTDNYGSNTTFIWGQHTYDNGGPIYTRNVTYVNFVSTPTRRAGALGPLRSGPFMLDTKNIMAQNTFINANRFWIEYGSNDCEYGWCVFDQDGTFTNVAGGTWIVSNVSHLLDSSCVAQPNWNAYTCPPFYEGYVQVTSTQAGLPDNVGANGVDYTVDNRIRVNRAEFIQLKTGLSGFSEGRDVGSLSQNYQTMQNLRSRQAYAIRYRVGDFLGKTPSSLTFSMESSNPGDWIVLAIPYPLSAWPLNINYYSYNGSPNPVGMTRVCSFEELSTTTYFYDDNQEWLYILLQSTAGPTSFTNKWGFVNYNGGNPAISVTANCPADGCSPTKTSPPLNPTMSIYYQEERYQGTLTGATGTGKAMFMFYPTTQALHYSIYHDISFKGANLVQLWNGNPASGGSVISSKVLPPFNSPVRGIFTLSRLQWTALAANNIYVVVSTNSNPQALVAQMVCDGTCSSPSPISNPVTIQSANCGGDPASILSVYNDTLNFPWNAASWNSSNPVEATTFPTYLNFNVSQNPFCGTRMMRLNVRQGALSFAIYNANNYLNVDLTKYKSFEFFAKLDAGFGETQLTISFRNASDRTLASVRISPQHIENGIIDEFSWTRVRIGLDSLGFTGNSLAIRRVVIQLTSTTVYQSILLDELRFTTEAPFPVPVVTPAACSNLDKADSAAASNFVSLFVLFASLLFLFF